MGRANHCANYTRVNLTLWQARSNQSNWSSGYRIWSAMESTWTTIEEATGNPVWSSLSTTGWQNHELEIINTALLLWFCLFYHFCSMPGATFVSRSFSSPEADSGIIWPGINSMKFSLTWVVDQAQDLCQRLWEEIPEEGEGALGGDQEGKGHVPGSGECHFVSFENSWHLKVLVM